MGTFIYSKGISLLTLFVPQAQGDPCLDVFDEHPSFLTDEIRNGTMPVRPNLVGLCGKVRHEQPLNVLTWTSSHSSCRAQRFLPNALPRCGLSLDYAFPLFRKHCKHRWAFRGDDIGEDFVIRVSSLRAAFLVTGTSQSFVGTSCFLPFLLILVKSDGQRKKCVDYSFPVKQDWPRHIWHIWRSITHK